MKYGQLHATQEHYRHLLENITRHPRQRLTRAAIPDGMVSNLTEQYPTFERELRRLRWVESDNTITAIGRQALAQLAAGDPPTGDDRR
jgi:hypothetical protein